MGTATFWKINDSGGAEQYEESNPSASIQNQLELLFSISTGDIINSPAFGHSLNELSHGYLEKDGLERTALILVAQVLVQYFPYVIATKVNAEFLEDGKVSLEIEYQVTGLDISNTITVTV
jgi:hypothetical protein